MKRRITFKTKGGKKVAFVAHTPSLKEQIEASMHGAGLKKDIGKGWSPAEMAVREREKALKEEEEDEE